MHGEARGPGQVARPLLWGWLQLAPGRISVEPLACLGCWGPYYACRVASAPPTGLRGLTQSSLGPDTFSLKSAKEPQGKCPMEAAPCLPVAVPKPERSV